MPLRVFRVCRSIYSSLDGEGAKRVGGRWNSPGRAVVNMAETVSLAVLENLVHMSRQDLPAGYVIVAAVIPDHVRVLRVEEIASEPGPVDERALGDRWFDSGASAVLEVRSRVVPIEHSYLLNPEHPDFAENHG